MAVSTRTTNLMTLCTVTGLIILFMTVPFSEIQDAAYAVINALFVWPIQIP